MQFLCFTILLCFWYIKKLNGIVVIFAHNSFDFIQRYTEIFTTLVDWIDTFG